MSILQEYAEIRKSIGEETYHDIERFLKAHPDLFLSDVYYKEDEWKHFLLWRIKNEENPRKKKQRQREFVKWKKEMEEEKRF